ncbi:hypothetical protein [Streptomyces sp. NPDC002265]|uniref:hypothetical protein n=1 Tax=Streptomyces sp. NPDC002265 TaxID=3154415 RepID=UPI0033185FE7
MVLTVPSRQPGMGTVALPHVYRDVMEVVANAPGPVRAKQIVPRIGLPAEPGKTEGTRSKLQPPHLAGSQLQRVAATCWW